MLKVAILDDYAGVALKSANWSELSGFAEIEVFPQHLSEDEAIRLLQPFDVLCTMRERMALSRRLFENLRTLRLVTIVGMSLSNLDLEAATDEGILIVHSDFSRPEIEHGQDATPELTWGLIIALVRNVVREERRMREGLWQSSAGILLTGRTLGLLGLGRVGRRVAQYGQAFGMDVIAWSQNLTPEAASAVGARRVEKEELFARSDILSIHVVLSDRTRGLVGVHELGLMKPSAYLVNTSRGPIVHEAALLSALREKRLAGAALDVFDNEPLPSDHPLRTMENALLTPHLGLATHETFAALYSDVPPAIAAFYRGEPTRVLNPEAIGVQRR